MRFGLRTIKMLQAQSLGLNRPALSSPNYEKTHMSVKLTCRSSTDCRKMRGMSAGLVGLRF